MTIRPKTLENWLWHSSVKQKFGLPQQTGHFTNTHHELGVDNYMPQLQFTVTGKEVANSSLTKVRTVVRYRFRYFFETVALLLLSLLKKLGAIAHLCICVMVH